MHKLVVIVVALFAVFASGPAAADLVDDCYRVGLGDPDKLIEICTRAIRSGATGSRLATAYNNRGRGHQEKKAFDRALSDFDMAIKINPRHVYAFDNRGDYWRLLGKFERAIAEYNAAIRIDPSFLSAYINRGMTFEQMGDRNSARADYQFVIKAAGKDREIDIWARDVAKERLSGLKD